MSVMGKNWIAPIGIAETKKMCLIVRFRLIKNIPYYFEYFGIAPQDFFIIEKKAWKEKGGKFFEIELKDPN